MNKKNSNKHHNKSTASNRTDKNSKSVSRTLKLTYKWWSYIFGIIGPITLVFTLSPKIDILPTSTLNPLSPFLAPFVISNKSVFSAYDVKPSFKLKKFETTYGETGVNFYNSAINMPGVNELKPNRSFSRFIGDDRLIGSPIAGKIKEGKIDLQIKYIYLFLTFEDLFSYRAYQAPDNTVTWLPE